MDIKNVIAGLVSGQLDWKNYNPNTSALGYNADVQNFLNYMGPAGLSALGFNADALNYNPPNDPEQLRQWLNSQVQSGAMTTYKLRVFYTPGDGTPAPVDVTFFAMAFNDGVFDSAGNLVFTNTGGDTATIQGLTTHGQGRKVSIQTLFDLTKTEPFTLGFIRMRPKTQAQLDLAMDILSDSQYGSSGSNSIAPDDYVNPDQYQLLRVDVPMNTNCSQKQGFTWTIDEDQTGTGISMTLFIPKTIDPTKQLSGGPAVRNLNQGVNPPFYTPTAATGQINAIASNEAIKSIIASNVAPSMGQNMIATILKTPVGAGNMGTAIPGNLAITSGKYV